jgi:hypothetical protein
VTPEATEWERERERANSQTQTSLIRLARLAGYTVDLSGGKGEPCQGHPARAVEALIIPNKIYRINAQQIIDALRRGLE